MRQVALAVTDQNARAASTKPTSASAPSRAACRRGVDPATRRGFSLADRIDADGVQIVDWHDDPDYVSVKLRDPDGYVVEVAWEEDQRAAT